jgi:hypothetical protein
MKFNTKQSVILDVYAAGRIEKLTAKEPLGKNMGTNVMDERLQTHALIDMLPAGKLTLVRSLLEAMLPDPEPLSASLARAEVEDEEITEETAAAIDRARASFARGERVSHEEILREFDLL